EIAWEARSSRRGGGGEEVEWGPLWPPAGEGSNQREQQQDQTGTAGPHQDTRKGPHHSQPHSRPYATFGGVPNIYPTSQ
ncbi:MAG TPA: hypothetical protein VK140_02970, partial [Ktedonobacteraceae bacterium]|nr:hypothetical protein [Ktedonobacteraceae bacterium]